MTNKCLDTLLYIAREVVGNVVVAVCMIILLFLAFLPFTLPLAIIAWIELTKQPHVTLPIIQYDVITSDFKRLDVWIDLEIEGDGVTTLIQTYGSNYTAINLGVSEYAEGYRKLAQQLTMRDLKQNMEIPSFVTGITQMVESSVADVKVTDVDVHEYKPYWSDDHPYQPYTCDK